MRGKIDMKSAVLGVGLGAVLLMLAGAAGGGSGGNPVGRFQIACTSTLCYLVDTVDGEVWSTGDKGFWESKLGVSTAATAQVPPVQPAQAAQPNEPVQEVQPIQPANGQGFVGRWVADNGDANVSLQIDADGTAITTDDVSHFQGTWNALGSQLIITVGNEILMASFMNDGRLLVTEPGNTDSRVIFRRAPQQ